MQRSHAVYHQVSPGFQFRVFPSLEFIAVCGNFNALCCNSSCNGDTAVTFCSVGIKKHTPPVCGIGVVVALVLFCHVVTIHPYIPTGGGSGKLFRISLLSFPFTCGTIPHLSFILRITIFREHVSENLRRVDVGDRGEAVDPSLRTGAERRGEIRFSVQTDLLSLCAVFTGVFLHFDKQLYQNGIDGIYSAVIICNQNGFEISIIICRKAIARNHMATPGMGVGCSQTNNFTAFCLYSVFNTESFEQ